MGQLGPPVLAGGPLERDARQPGQDGAAGDAGDAARRWNAVSLYDTFLRDDRDRAPDVELVARHASVFAPGAHHAGAGAAWPLELHAGSPRAQQRGENTSAQGVKAQPEDRLRFNALGGS